MDGFFDTVKALWDDAPVHGDALQRLDCKLRGLAKGLQSWSQRKVGSIRDQLSLANEPARVAGLRDGDANSQFFRILASSRRWRNNIAALRHGDQTAVEQVDKEELATAFFVELLDRAQPRAHDISLAALGSHHWTLRASIYDMDCLSVATVRKEAQLLQAINHWSLMRSLCFIDKGNEFIMISEYVSNGNLRQHLHGQHQKILDLNQRILIAIDVAIALTYLHLSADFSFVDENGNPPPLYALPFKLGVVDGAEQQPGRNGSPRRNDDRPGRRDDDDRDERGGRDRSHGWRESLRRSLSRNSRRAPRDDSRGGHPDHGRYDSHDGGTWRADSVVELQAPVLQAVVTAHAGGDSFIELQAPVLPAAATAHAGAEAEGSGAGSSLAACEAALLALDARRTEPTAARSFTALSPRMGGAARGHSPARTEAPHSARQLSRSARTPPTSPDSVLPSSAATKMMLPTGHQEMSAAAHLICSPVILQRSLTTASSPSQPSGFAGSPQLSLSRPPGFSTSPAQALHATDSSASVGQRID
ncbi:hypothetical protein ACQ4PT_032672 [Festuca glaucescens]